MSKGKRGSWYSMVAAGDDRAEIHIYDQIGADWLGEGITAKSFIEDLQQYRDRELDVHINSPGGAVFEGVAIYNALARHEPRVDVSIDGMALSIASVIAMAGDHIRIAENGLMMIHDPWTQAVGNAADFRREADTLDKVAAGMVSSYQTRTGLDREQIAGLMAAETWLSPAEAKDYGFVDEISAPLRMAASFDLSAFHYRHTPKGALLRAKVLINELDAPD